MTLPKLTALTGLGPTRERVEKAPLGVEASGRARLRAIFTLPEEIAEALETWSRAQTDRGRDLGDVEAPSALAGKGTLDRALAERPHLRQALARYVEDYAITERGPRIPAYGQRAADIWTADQISAAHSRVAHIRHGGSHGRGALAYEHRAILDWMAVTMLNLPGGEVTTVYDIGRELGRFEHREDCRHVFIGYAIGVAEALHEAYRVWARAQSEGGLGVAARMVEGAPPA